MNTALLAEYLALTHFPPENPSPDDFRRMNQMALQLSMEMPDAVLTVLFSQRRTGTYKDAWDTVDACRRFTCQDDPRYPEHCVVHAPNASDLQRNKP